MIFLKFNNLLFVFFFLLIYIFLPLNANEKNFFLNEGNSTNFDKLKKDINVYKKEYDGNWIIDKSSKDSEEIKWEIDISSKDAEDIKWEIDISSKDAEDIKWEIEKSSKDVKENKLILEKESFKNKTNEKIEDKNNLNKKVIIGSLNRSLIFDDEVIGPDISWMVPPGFKWNKKYKFDSSIRGFSRREEGQSFFGWNGGDAVGQVYYQFLNGNRSSLGINLGLRSVYSGEKVGGNSFVGEGISAGFRYDRSLSPSAGFAFGGEQILHFDGLTDTGRDLYFSLSKAWWRNNKEFNFPLFVSTAALATGKMAEGTINGLCSDLFGGSGTEIKHKRRLCWAPVFSLSSLFNENLSLFFEYNSYNFILGSSLVPLSNIPLRITLATVISDHINNYQIKSLDENTWIFRISLGL